LRRLDVKRAPRIAIEQMPQLCNDSHSQLKGIASFLSHFSSSVTASQPFSRTTWTASRVVRFFLSLPLLPLV
jgi:hypothetical protein